MYSDWICPAGKKKRIIQKGNPDVQSFHCIQSKSKSLMFRFFTGHTGHSVTLISFNKIMPLLDIFVLPKIRLKLNLFLS